MYPHLLQSSRTFRTFRTFEPEIAPWNYYFFHFRSYSPTTSLPFFRHPSYVLRTTILTLVTQVKSSSMWEAQHLNRKRRNYPETSFFSFVLPTFIQENDIYLRSLPRRSVSGKRQSISITFGSIFFLFPKNFILRPFLSFSRFYLIQGNGIFRKVKNKRKRRTG